jgi:hypothetical protein
MRKGAQPTADFADMDSKFYAGFHHEGTTRFSGSWDRGGRDDRELTLHDLRYVVEQNRKRPSGRRRPAVNAAVFS